MATDKRRAKVFIKKYKALNSRIKALIQKGLPFHHEMADLHTMIALEDLKQQGSRPQDLNWFLDAISPETIADVRDDRLASYPGSTVPASSLLDPRMAIDLGSRLVHGASVFSHTKSVELSELSNWVRLTEGLMMGLLLTELKGTTANDIKMPLPSFIIELPPGTVYTHDHYTGWHETKYIIVTESVSPHFGDCLFIYVYSQPNENSINIFDDHAEYFPIDVSYKDESLAEVIDVYEQLRKEDIKSHGGTIFHESLGMIFGEEYYSEDFREKIIRIVINTIIYMTSASAVVEHEDKDKIDHLIVLKDRRRLKVKDQKTLEEMESTPHFVLGTDITITRADIEAIDNAQKEDRRRGQGGRKLKHPSITRGHWRQQPYGPGRTLRKRIWIRPFIRGKELGGPVRGHTYTLENPFSPEESFDDYDE